MEAEGIGVFDVTTLVAELCKQVPERLAFEPTDVQLSDLAISASKTNEEPHRFVSISAENQPRINSFLPEFPFDRDVIAIDSTSIVLGYVPEGLVGAIRASVIIKPKGKKHHRKEQYGAYLVVITNYNKDHLYASTRKLVYEEATRARAPDLRKTLDRLRSLLERRF